MSNRYFSLVSCTFALMASTAPALAADLLDLYVVRGEPSQLTAFHSDVAKDWQGGKFLERISSNTEYRYWAYSSRTAREARVFMFGSMEQGLRFDIEAYDEKTYYPTERALLDEVLSRCGFKSDASFIEPDRVVRLNVEAEKAPGAAACLRGELNKTSIGREMPVRSVESKTPDERG